MKKKKADPVRWCVVMSLSELLAEKQKQEKEAKENEKLPIKKNAITL
jgi:hypothetical protein